jgi:hypothetical protein
MSPAVDVPEEVRALLAQLARPRPMRRGTLTERFVKCSKPGCACARSPEARHGPYFSLTRVVNGRTQTRLVPAEAAGAVREQVEADRSFRADVDAYRAACERWADATLAGPPQEGERGGSRGASSRRSERKSRR